MDLVNNANPSQGGVMDLKTKVSAIVADFFNKDSYEYL